MEENAVNEAAKAEAEQDPGSACAAMHMHLVHPVPPCRRECECGREAQTGGRLLAVAA